MLVKPIVRSIVRHIAGNPVRASGSGFSPTSLFSDGSKGVVYDNNDLSSFYLDAAGTTAATVNGLVGLQLDKSAGLVLGAELVTNGDFSAGATGWTTVSWVISGGAASIVNAIDSVATNVSFTAGKFYQVTYTLSGFAGTGGFRPRFFGGTTVTGSTVSANGTYTELMQAVTGNTQVAIASTSATCSGTVDNISVKELPGNHRYQTTTGSKPVLRGTPVGSNIVTNGDFASGATNWTNASTGTGSASIGSGVATLTGVDLSNRGRYNSGNFTTVIGGVYRIRWTVVSGTVSSQVTVASSGTVFDRFGASVVGVNEGYFTAGATSTSIAFNVYGAGTVVFDNFEVVDASAGAVTAPYGLQYDGVDDFMQTAAVDFTATDKMFVCAGVRKLSDAAFGTLVELSASVTANNGAFAMFAPLGGSPGYEVRSKGTAAEVSTNVSAGYPAPITNVLTQIANIATPVVTLRVNGSQVGSNPASQGTGNYGNYALYFGRRGGTSVPLNGLDFGFVICGKTLTSTQISSTERYIAQRTGIAL